MIIKYTLLIVIIICVIYIGKNCINIDLTEINNNNEISLNNNKDLIIENFNSNNNQHGNVIFAGKPESSTQIKKTSINNNDKIIEVELGGLYKITDIRLEGNPETTKDDNDNEIEIPDLKNKTIRCSVFNSSTSKNNYINVSPGGNTIIDKITTIPANETFTQSNVKTIYGNELIGDKINIYCIGSDLSDKLWIKVCGILSTEKLSSKDLEYLDKDANILNSSSNSQTIYSSSSDSVISINSNDKLYKITSIEFNDSSSDEDNITLYYGNNYTSEIMIFKSDRPNGSFMVTNGYNKIFFYDNILLANKIYLKDDNDNITTSNISIKGYKATKNDITTFKLQNGLTDIRGSINPDDICPGIDGLIHDQLSAETIVDSLEYQEKIKDEKIKLQSNKEALLHLLEQKEKIDKVGTMIDKIEDLRTKRERETDALNAIRLTKQIDEVNKLKEVLDARIEQNKKNTINLDNIRVNVIKNIDVNEEDNNVAEVEGFSNVLIPNEENMSFN